MAKKAGNKGKAGAGRGARGAAKGPQSVAKGLASMPLEGGKGGPRIWFSPPPDPDQARLRAGKRGPGKPRGEAKATFTVRLPVAQLAWLDALGGSRSAALEKVVAGAIALAADASGPWLRKPSAR